jgi:hypothetical protein
MFTYQKIESCIAVFAICYVSISITVHELGPAGCLIVATMMVKEWLVECGKQHCHEATGDNAMTIICVALPIVPRA